MGSLVAGAAATLTGLKVVLDSSRLGPAQRSERALHVEAALGMWKHRAVVGGVEV